MLDRIEESNFNATQQSRRTRRMVGGLIIPADFSTSVKNPNRPALTAAQNDGVGAIAAANATPIEVKMFNREFFGPKRKLYFGGTDSEWTTEFGPSISTLGLNVYTKGLDVELNKVGVSTEFVLDDGFNGDGFDRLLSAFEKGLVITKLKIQATDLATQSGDNSVLSKLNMKLIVFNLKNGSFEPMHIPTNDGVTGSTFKDGYLEVPTLINVTAMSQLVYTVPGNKQIDIIYEIDNA